MGDQSAQPVGENQVEGEDGFVPIGAPRWVRVLGVVVLALIVVFLVVQLATGGEHRPGRHAGGGDGGAEAVELDAKHRPPAGVSHGG